MVEFFRFSLDKNELDSTLAYLDNIRFNYVDYLKDAKSGITMTAEKTSKWSLRYDVNSTSTSDAISRRGASKSSQIVQSQLSSSDLDADVEEFFFNLNLSSNTFNEVVFIGKSQLAGILMSL